MIELFPEQTLRAQLERVNQNTIRFETPDTPYYPLGALDDDLERYGFPPRPNEYEHPELFAFWRKMFERGIEEFAEIDFSLLPPHLGTGSAQSARSLFTRTHREGSLNWSGAYITPRDGLMFTDVVGSWFVPTVSAPPGWPPSDTYGSSVWIGLDGQRRYLHSTLPQIGTGQYLNLPSVPGSTTTAWFQWWPQNEMTLPMTMVPGDYVMAWLLVLNLTQVHMILLNWSRLSLARFVWPAPMVIMPPFITTPLQASVSGATAEWITERPAVAPTPVLYNLPNYSTVRFEDCMAASALNPGLAFVDRDVDNPRLIRMYRRAQSPRRAVTISVARRVSEHEVETRYQV